MKCWRRRDGKPLLSDEPEEVLTEAEPSDYLRTASLMTEHPHDGSDDTPRYSQGTVTQMRAIPPKEHTTHLGTHNRTHNTLKNTQHT